jgi:hypothetical protein
VALDTSRVDHPEQGELVVHDRDFDRPRLRRGDVIGLAGTTGWSTGCHLHFEEWTGPGWYAGGTRPGDPGSAVILGHVDSKRGPAVFFRLHELRKGDEIEVGRADGSSVRFVVQRTEQYPKDRFPTDDVYYPTLTPALRLVTCGGEFDATAGHYRSNVIVFATMHS